MTEQKNSSTQAQTDDQDEARIGNLTTGHDSDGAKQQPALNRPLSDGSEEFFDQFMPQEEEKTINKKNLYLGLGVTLGLIAGVGTTLWLRKAKRNRRWWCRLFGKR